LHGFGVTIYAGIILQDCFFFLMQAICNPHHNQITQRLFCAVVDCLMHGWVPVLSRKKYSPAITIGNFTSPHYSQSWIQAHQKKRPKHHLLVFTVDRYKVTCVAERTRYRITNEAVVAVVSWRALSIPLYESEKMCCSYIGKHNDQWF